ncbi:MAG: hypothetical protein R3E48_21410 [Burkholderiaceae bacterium]
MRAAGCWVRWLLAATMSASAPAHAARLDDIAPPRHLRLELEWAQPGGRDATGLHRMRARAPGVEYLLDTGPYRRRMARIYYVLPLDAAGLTSPFGLRVSWQARGELRSGEGRAGARVLVYEGRIDAPDPGLLRPRSRGRQPLLRRYPSLRPLFRDRCPVERNP